MTLLLGSTLAVLGRAPYDDEIANFHMVQGKDLRSIIQAANSADVHPPGSYVLNALLYDLFDSWDSAKIAGGCLNALALALFVWLAYEKLPVRARRWFTFMLATASTVILWGASVRWYAYFNPLFTTALAVVLFADIGRTLRTIVLGVSAVLLFYLGYAALCALPVLIVAHLGRDRADWKSRDWVILLFTGAAALALCMPQLLVFVRVHMPNNAHQVGTPAMALLQSGMTLVLGNAVFPLAPLPIGYGLVALGALGFWLIARRKSPLEWLVLGALMTGIVCMVVTGVGIKPRNSVYLLPLAMFVISSAIASLPNPLYTAAALVLVAFQGVGLWNVIRHEDTLKGSYNADFQAALQQIRRWNANCSRTVVFNHDPVMSYLLDRAGIPQSSPYEQATKSTVEVASGDCVAMVRTFHGVLPPATAARMYATAQLETMRTLDSVDLGQDRYFAVKGRLSHDSFPRVYIHIDLCRSRRKLSLPDWSVFATPEGEARSASQ